MGTPTLGRGAPDSRFRMVFSVSADTAPIGSASSPIYLGTAHLTVVGAHAQTTVSGTLASMFLAKSRSDASMHPPKLSVADGTTGTIGAGTGYAVVLGRRALAASAPWSPVAVDATLAAARARGQTVGRAPPISAAVVPATAAAALLPPARKLVEAARPRRRELSTCDPCTAKVWGDFNGDCTLDSNDLGELSAMIVSRLSWQQGFEDGTADPLETGDWLTALGVSVDATCREWLALQATSKPHALRAPPRGTARTISRRDRA